VFLALLHHLFNRILDLICAGTVFRGLFEQMHVLGQLNVSSNLRTDSDVVVVETGKEVNEEEGFA
jgi:hypothetical protein